MSKQIIRVFPRKTNATPCDENVRIRSFPGLFDQADEVHISVAFTWDRQWAETAEKQVPDQHTRVWQHVFRIHSCFARRDA
jgi:hypothetical protein